MSSARIPETVRRVFTEAFTARDIAEPLASFDGSVSSQTVLDYMRTMDFDVVGVRVDGHVVGYLERHSLDGGECGQFRQPIERATVCEDSVPLLTVLTELDRSPFLLISVLGTPCGIITRTDLQKALVRMWLFGVVTLIEMRCTELIERHCPDDAWMEYVSAGRLVKAEALLEERRRRNQSLRLFDCLQFSDKGQIVARHEAIRGLTRFASRRQAEEAVKNLEQLRNNLAHAQDILTTDWGTIVQLCDFVQGS